jgi:hypothetical protein
MPAIEDAVVQPAIAWRGGMLEPLGSDAIHSRRGLFLIN